MDNISSSKWIVRVLQTPLRQPWSAGNTWILVGVATVSVWVSFTLWWILPAVFALALIVGGVWRTSIDAEKWEELQVHRLQQHLLWIIDNRNTIARLAGARYMGTFLDTNDPLKWEASRAPQPDEHPDLKQLRQKLQMTLAVERSQRPAEIEAAERRGLAKYHALRDYVDTFDPEMVDAWDRIEAGTDGSPGTDGPEQPEDTDTVSTRPPVREE